MRCTFASSRHLWRRRSRPIRGSAGPPWRNAREHGGRNVSIEVKVPQLPESVTDATLVNWHKKAGDPVRRDENLVDLETDKVVLEVPAPSDGVIKEIKVSDGTTVTSGQVLAVLEPGAAGVRSDGGGDAAAERQAPAGQVAVEPAERPRAGAVAADTAGRGAARSAAARQTE